MYFFKTYLEVRQLRANKLTTLPKTLEGVISEDTFQKTRSYSLDHRFYFVLFRFLTLLDVDVEFMKLSSSMSCYLLVLLYTAVYYLSRFHFACEFVTIVRDSAILFFGVMPWFWKVRICLVFMNLMFITVFTSLPFNDNT